MMDEWRENFKGVKAPKHGLMITGAVDDIWKSGDGDTEEWYVVDYKSTASNANISLPTISRGYIQGRICSPNGNLSVVTKRTWAPCFN